MGPVVAATYSGSHWRHLSLRGGDPELTRRVLFRQATIDGVSRAEIVDGLDWRPLRDDEFFVPGPSAVPQVDNGWVR